MALGVGVLLVANIWGLMMTGMEHTLHVLLSLLVMKRFFAMQEQGRRGDGWLLTGIVLLPLIRFEGAALAL